MLVRTLALCAAVLLLGSAAPTESAGADGVIAAMTARNAGMRGYTFDISLRVALLTFPWIHFRMNGHGEYQRNGTHTLHFDRVPWFGHGFETINLEALDPASWPATYTITLAEQHEGTSVLSMHDRVKSSLIEARATIDETGVRDLLCTYDYGGRVDVAIVPVSISGYFLPGTEDADIVMPHYHARAHAEFSNYHVTTDPTPTAAQ